MGKEKYKKRRSRNCAFKKEVGGIGLGTDQLVAGKCDARIGDDGSHDRQTNHRKCVAFHVPPPFQPRAKYAMLTGILKITND
jgi:hypothetical protein